MLGKVFILTLLAALAVPVPGYAESPIPVEIYRWIPPFNEDLRRERTTFEPLESAEKPWRLCASIPHLKDAYWLTVNFALVDESKRLGVRLEVLEAGGYGNLALQREQITKCLQRGADALIVGGISSDGLNDLISKWVAQGKPVIDLINGLSDPDITARSAADFWDSGFQIGEYLKQQVAAGSGKSVLWLPGPEGQPWSAAADRGFRAALSEMNFRILGPVWGDVSRGAQLYLIESALRSNPDVDYIVVTAVGAEAAVDILRESGGDSDIKILSYYYSSVVDREIRRGRIAAAVTDKQGLQARMAINQSARISSTSVLFRFFSKPLGVEDVELTKVRHQSN